jgi:hypothetical protein
MNGVTKTIEDVWFARDVMNTVQASLAANDNMPENGLSCLPEPRKTAA